MLARHGDVGGKNESHALSIVTAVNIGCQALQVGFVINMIYLIVTLTFIAKHIAVKVLGILNDVKGTADGLSCIACLITIYWGKGYGIDACSCQILLCYSLIVAVLYRYCIIGVLCKSCNSCLKSVNQIDGITIIQIRVHKGRNTYWLIECIALNSASQIESVFRSCQTYIETIIAFGNIFTYTTNLVDIV